MTAYIAKRLLAIFPMFLGITVVLFLIINMAPGGPEYFFVSQNMQLQAVANIRHNLGLDAPIHIRYFKWVANLLQGRMGYSLIGGGIKVSQLIFERLGATLLLTGVSLVLAIVVGISIGILSAVRQYSLIDHMATIYAYFGISFPGFWLGIMLIYLFAFLLGWLPAVGMNDYGGSTLSLIKHLILPVFALSTMEVAAFMRFSRSSMMEVLYQDYIQTARSKGLPEWLVIYKHAFRNALLSVVTIAGMRVRNLISGAVYIEVVFSWPGLGRLTINSVYHRDYPVIMGICVVTSLAVIIANLLVDISYCFIDPRISYE